MNLINLVCSPVLGRGVKHRCVQREDSTRRGDIEVYLKAATVKEPRRLEVKATPGKGFLIFINFSLHNSGTAPGEVE